MFGVFSSARRACVISMLSILITGSISAQEQATAQKKQRTHRYPVNGLMVELTEDDSNLCFQLDPQLSKPQKKQALQRITELAGSTSPQALPREIYLLTDSSTGPGLETLLESVALDPAVIFAERTYRYKNHLQIPTGRIIAGFEPGATLEKLNLCQDLGLTIKDPVDWLQADRLDLTDSCTKTTLEIVAELSLLPELRFVEPEFLFQATRSAPNDPLFPDSWHLKNSGQEGGSFDADMDVNQAWDLETGNPDIIIAIIDEGVDMDHEDLAANIVGGFDLTDGSPPGGVAGNPRNGDGHGTACAGIASAVQNNGKGTSGVAPGCSLLAIRIGYGGNGSWTTNDWAAAGIQVAWREGASVLSNSWGGGTPSTAVDTAIADARTLGRNGLGSVVLFAAGNEDEPVEYPAWNSMAIAVGATSLCDERKTSSSCDGENWWGSNYGPTLDVVAPGVKIRTTDIMGSGGYTSSNYMSDMNGTSAATPAVAGVVGLMLSKNPLLTAQEVGQILRGTAEDLVGKSTEDVPGFDIYMGYGRVNAFQALMAVSPPEAPIISSVDPGFGPVAGGNKVTIHGDNFLGEIDVRIGSASCSYTIIDRETITITVPAATVIGSSTVEIDNLGGTGILPGGYAYEENQSTITFEGYPRSGRNITLHVTGPQGGRFAIAADTQAGNYEKQGHTFCFAGPTSSGFEIVQRFGQGIFDASGRAQVTFRVPDAPVFSNVFLHAATLDQGNLEVSECLTLTVF